MITYNRRSSMFRIAEYVAKVGIVAVALAVAAGSGNAVAQQTKLKWAHVYETSEPYHKWSVWAAGEIEKRTAGKYHIDVFPASTLGKESDLNQGMTLGTVDMIISGLSFAARTMPRIGVGYYPYTFRDGEHLIKFSKSPLFKEMVDEYRNKTGIQITAMTYYGARHTTSNKPFTDCAGMKGLKMRVPDVPAYLALPKSCGANPTPIAFAEVYLALQNGTVDAQENPLTTIEAKKFYEVQKYVILTGHIIDSLATQVAPHVWSKLSDPEKKIFTDVTLEAAASATADIQKREGELADEFRKKGLTVTAVDKKSFQDAILKNVTFESMGYSKADWDKIQQIK
jgi:tripartite ATP-independent periplasmic transporter solute receptor, DctP family